MMRKSIISTRLRAWVACIDREFGDREWTRQEAREEMETMLDARLTDGQVSGAMTDLQHKELIVSAGGGRYRRVKPAVVPPEERDNQWRAGHILETLGEVEDTRDRDALLWAVLYRYMKMRA